jgi:hypothetical protein
MFSTKTFKKNCQLLLKNKKPLLKLPMFKLDILIFLRKYFKKNLKLKGVLVAGFIGPLGHEKCFKLIVGG